MRRHSAVVCLFLATALAGCGRDSGSGTASSDHGPGAVPKNIETQTKEKVDAAIAAGKAATDDAIEAASGKAPAREGGD